MPESHFHLFRNYIVQPEVSGPAGDRIIFGAPRFNATNSYESADGKRFCGQWQSTTGAWRVIYDEWEYCHILTGRAVIRSDAGEAWEVSAGDSFVLEPGFKGSWTVTEPLTKLYTIIL
jgi:uncharacterized protein